MSDRQIVQCECGPQVFRFMSYKEWVRHATSWFHQHELRHDTALCFDGRGRICRIGRDFIRARDEDEFPITVHPYRPKE